MEAPVDYTAIKYSLDLSWVMSFLLVPQLPMFVAIERRITASDGQTDRHYKNLYIDIYNIDGYIENLSCLHRLKMWHIYVCMQKYKYIYTFTL